MQRYTLPVVLHAQIQHWHNPCFSPSNVQCTQDKDGPALQNGLQGVQEHVSESMSIPTGNGAMPTAVPGSGHGLFWYAMNRPLEHYPEVDRYAAARKTPPVVIIGAGPVGQRVATEFLRQSRQKPVPVILFDADPRALDDREPLSVYLAADTPNRAVTGQLDDDPRLTLCLGTEIVAIDRERRVVTDCNVAPIAAADKAGV